MVESRHARERKGLSRRELAEATGLSYPYISQLETGYRQPSPAAIRNLADVLDLSLDEIFAAIGRRTDETDLAQQPPTDSGWIPNARYKAGAVQADGMVRLNGSAPAAPVAPVRQAAPAPVLRVPAPAAAGGAAPAAAGGASPAAAGGTAPTVGPPNAMPSTHLMSAALPQTAGGATSFANDVIEQVIDVLSVLPASERLAAVANIQERVIEAVIDERIRRPGRE